ncbi:hypothetical protein Delta_p61 [Pseudomonas phage Delta]|nr:hypothetical protein Delta_p61 [Pseudomonas phage Delta]
MKLNYNMLTSKVRVASWDDLESGRLYIRQDEDGAANPRVFMYMEVADEFFIVEIFGGPVGAVYFSGDVDCGFYPVTIKAASIEVHRFGPPA